MFKPLELPQLKKVPSARTAHGSFLAFVATLLWLALPSRANATDFTVSLDRNIITLGETATLTMTFEGDSPNVLPTFPSVPNLRILDQGSDSIQESIQYSGAAAVRISRRSHAFSVVPSQAGEFTIPAISASINGQVVNSQPLKLTVLKESAPTAAPQIAFLRLVVPKTEVYIGELLPIELQIYAQAGKLSEMPAFKQEGFTVGKMMRPDQSQTIYNGQRYFVVSFKTYVIPAKAGNLDLGPATAGINVPRPNSRQDFFGNFVDWQAIPLQSDPQTLHALPLPRENVPPAFSGAVGNYSISLTASPTNIAIGDPITVTVQVTGHGAVDSVTLPTQKNWQEFQIYPPTSDFQPADNDPLGVSGVKTFKLTVVPQSMDVRELPAFQFSFFDPDQKVYRTLTQPAVPLFVRPSAASLPPPALSTTATPGDTTAPASGLLHIKPRLGVVAQLQPPLVQQPWFVALQGVPVLAWLSLLVVRKQKEHLAANPRTRRRREVDQTVRNGLKELRRAATAGQPDEFFATLFHLLQEQLGERLDLPASAITEAVLDERLRPLSVSEETLASLRELFLACNQARYARQSSNEELISLIPTVEYVLTELKKIPA
jgi:hypothetical protein